MTGCGDIEFLGSSGSSEVEEESIFVKSPQFIVYKDGKTDTIVKSEEGTLYEKRQRLELTRPHIKYFERGEYIAELNAEKGILFLQDFPNLKRKENDIILSQDVEYKNIDGTKLKTDALVWDNKKQMISSESDFYMERPTEKGTFILEGKRFETDKRLSKWKDYGASMRIISNKS
jgi:LPS export ABC transporter protein LptC